MTLDSPFLLPSLAGLNTFEMGIKFSIHLAFIGRINDFGFSFCLAFIGWTDDSFDYPFLLPSLAGQTTLWIIRFSCLHWLD
jgi:hypothetical protein